MITLLAITVAGGNENTEYFVLSVSAEAIPALSVDMAAISPPSISDQDMEQEGLGHVLKVYCPCGTDLGRSHRCLRLQKKEPDEIARYRLQSLAMLLELLESLCSRYKSQRRRYQMVLPNGVDCH